MIDALNAELASPGDGRLGRTFRRIGWLGFWVQLVIGSIPLIIGATLFLFNRSALIPGGSLNLIGLLALASMLILAFTTLWFWRYVRVGRSIEQGDSKWTPSKLSRIVWTGLTASCIGILFSTVVMVAEVAYLLVNFLEAPQAGLPVIQTTSGEAGATWISAIDMMSLMALILTVAAEIIVLVLGLWLLSRVMAGGTKAAAKAAGTAPGKA